MSSEPTDPTPANPWFADDLASTEPLEADIAEVLDPTDPDALQRLLQALRKL